MLLIYLFQYSLLRTEIFECAKITRWSVVTKKFCNFAVIESNQMPLGNFMCIGTINKRVKFHVKIPKWLLRKWQQLYGILFCRTLYNKNIGPKMARTTKTLSHQNFSMFLGTGSR